MSRSYRLPIAVFAGCLAVSLFASPVLGQVEDQDAASEQDSEADEKAAVEALASSPPANTKIRDEQHDGKGRQPKHKDTQEEPGGFVTWWVANVGGRDGYAQWIMAVFGAAAFGVSVWAVCLLKKTLDATKNAVEQAREGTQAANAAVEVTERTAKAQLRAYVHIEQVWREPTEYAPKDLVAVKIRNSGQSFAFDVSVRSRFFWTADRHAAQFPADHQEMSKTPKSVIGPNAIQTISAYVPHDHAGYAKFLRGDGCIFIYGRVTYKDIFGEEHWSDFRLWNDDQPIASFSNCAEGNSAT